MKTVQYFLQQTDPQLLIDNYLLKYPLELEDFEPTKTVGEIEEAVRHSLADYLKHLISLKAATNNGGLVFYVYHHVDQGVPEPSFALSILDELDQQGVKAPSYSYLYSSHADLMGFFVAENGLTKHYLTELLVDILHEASFFGFHQEELRDADQQPAENAQPLTPVEQRPPLPATDEFSPAEQPLVKQLQSLATRLATESRRQAIEEILGGN